MRGATSDSKYTAYPKKSFHSFKLSLELPAFKDECLTRCLERQALGPPWFRQDLGSSELFWCLELDGVLRARLFHPPAMKLN